MINDFPWWLTGLIGMCFGILVGFIATCALAQKLSDIEKKSNKK